VTGAALALALALLVLPPSARPRLVALQMVSHARQRIVACHVHGTVSSRVLPRSWDHLVASNGTTRRVVPGCPRRSGSSTRVGADRRAAGPVLSADVSVLGHRPGRCRVGRRCAGAGPDVRADCPPAVSRTGRGPRKGLMGGKGDVGSMIRVLRARMTLLAVDEAGMSTVEYSIV
jgi:hypothetical protein